MAQKSEAKSSVKHIELIDYLRGIAILGVLLVHTFDNTFGYSDLPWKGLFRDFSVPVSFLYFLPINVGLMGVPIFFVVSGFCIHMSFQQQGKNWGSFFIRRIFRIYPAYLAALIFFTSINAEHYHWNLQGQDWTQITAHLFLIHNFTPQHYLGSTGRSGASLLKRSYICCIRYCWPWSLNWDGSEL